MGMIVTLIVQIKGVEMGFSLSFYYWQLLSFIHAPENVLEIEHAKGMQKYATTEKKYMVTELDSLSLLIMPQFLDPILNDRISNFFGICSFSLQVKQYLPGLCPKAVECKLTIAQFQ